VKQKTDPSRTTDIGMARYSDEYFTAANLVAHHGGLESIWTEQGLHYSPKNHVAYQLVGQSLELGFKSKLLSLDATCHDDLHAYGHDIEKSIEAINQIHPQFLDFLSKEDYINLKLLNAEYKNHRLRYIVTGTATYPCFCRVFNINRKLLFALSQENKYLARRVNECDFPQACNV